MEEDKVTFYSEGQKVHGTLYIPNVKNPPAVIITHGYGGFVFENRYKILASKLCKSGYAVLTLIFRGYSPKTGDKSEKNFREITISGEASDLKAAIDFLYDRGYDKIGFTAESFGGVIALFLNDPRIKAFALWSTNFHIKKSFQGLYGEKTIKELEERGQSVYTSHTNGKKFIIKRNLWNEVKIIDGMLENKIKEINCPMLIIYGTNDKHIEYYKELYKIVNRPKKLIAVENADHTFSRPEYTKKLIKSIIKWFEEWLK